MPINSYPTVFAIGHSAIKEIFNGVVVVQEKIDGSQFSFGLIDGELVCRSKGKELILDAPEKMFNKAVATVKSIAHLLHPDWIYRGEFLQSPKHNTLAYERTPVNNIMLFDIDTGNQQYLIPLEVRLEAERIGLECVPTFYVDEISDFEMFQSWLDSESDLGGCKVEGVVVKNYSVFTQEKKAAMGKYVSEAFKEKHEKDWKVRNPTGKDVVEQLIDSYSTEARWRKAIQHKRDEGQLDGSPKDIGLLIREIPADILKDSQEEIKNALFRHFWPKIQRGVTRGFPEFYKQELAKSAFETKE